MALTIRRRSLGTAPINSCGRTAVLNVLGALVVLYFIFTTKCGNDSIFLAKDGVRQKESVNDTSIGSYSDASIKRLNDTSSVSHNNLNLNGCKRLGLPKPINEIPLPPSAYEMDHGQSNNFVMGIFDKKEVQMEEGQPPLLIHIALPRGFFKFLNEKTGLIENLGNSQDTWDRASASKPGDGIFIDIGGFNGDSALPSAALGIDTYVFEPVRFNTNLIHYSVLANHCRISEHLTVINALVGDKNSATESVYVTNERTDNAAATKSQAVKNVGQHDQDYEQPVHMIKLDSFFPPGTKVQNLKIDVQGFELHVLRGAERLLKENKGRLKVRAEYDVGLLKMAGTNPADLPKFLKDLGYNVIKAGGDMDFE